MSNTGTGVAKFVATTGSDIQIMNGKSQPISTKSHCITLMNEYLDKSLEELRFEDYLANRKGPDEKIGVQFGLKNNTGIPYEYQKNKSPFGFINQPSWITNHNGSTNTSSANIDQLDCTMNSPASGNKNLFGSTVSNPTPANTGMFGSPLNKLPSGNTGLFGSTENNPASENTSPFVSTLNNPAFGNTNLPTFGSTVNKPTFGHTGTFGSLVTNPPSGNTSIFGSTVNSPASGNTTSFGSTVNKPTSGHTGVFGSFVTNQASGNTSIFGSTVNIPASGNTTLFGSTVNKPTSGFTGVFGPLVTKPPSGNTSIFGSTVNSSASGNTTLFGSTVNNPTSGHTGVFGSLVTKPPSGNTSIFGSSVNSPASGNTTSFGSTVNKPTSGNMSLFGSALDRPLTSTFTVPQSRQETESFTFNTFSSPSNVPTSGLNGASSFSMLPSESSRNLCFAFGSTTASIIKHGTNSQSHAVRVIRKTVKPKPCLDFAPSPSTKTCNNTEETPSVGESEKFKFNLSNIKTPGSQSEFSLQTSQYENCDEEIKKIVSDLEELVECPVCLGNLDSSLKQCENGHAICGSCFNNVAKCPTCQQGYLPNKPTLLWKILDRLPKKCLFADKGCDKIFLNKKEDHEMFCKYRPTSCKFESCDWKGTVAEVIDHVKSCKQSTKYNLCEVYFPSVDIVQMYTFDKAQDVSFYSAIVFENQLFWKYFHRDSSSKNITHKLYHIAPHKPMQKYYLIVSFNKGEIEFKTCIGATYETDNDSKGKINNEISFFVPDKDLERFYDTDAKGYAYCQKIIVE